MESDIFKLYSPNTDKLKAFGFTSSDGGYKYETSIFDGRFNLHVCITESGDISTKLIDAKLNDEYVLHLIEGSVGEFVGKVRAKYEDVLIDIRDKCFDKDIFKSVQAKEVIEYVKTKYGDELEFLWEKFPDNAIWRRKDNNKWYAVLLVLNKSKLGLPKGDTVDIIDLRSEPSEIALTVDNKKYFGGYHMNKNNWITICLDNSVPTEEILDRIDNSYTLAAKK